MAGLGSAAVWPVAARAQPSTPVIGFLNSGSADLFAPYVASFHHGLEETGFVEGKNVTIEYRWADNQYDRLSALAADLVHRQVAVIVANTPAAVPAKKATTTIPIVFVTGVNPIEVGLVTALSRPGGNLTGVSTLDVELAPKRLEFVHELIPRATTIAALINPTNSIAASQSRLLNAAAQTLGLKLHILQASAERDLDVVFSALVGFRAEALVVAGDAFFVSRSEQLAGLALRYAMPAVFQYRPFAAAGGLMSYGGDLADSYRRIGVYAGRILKGEKPADLPVDQDTKIELIINLKTAKSLGITVPLSLLGRADEVIE